MKLDEFVEDRKLLRSGKFTFPDDVVKVAELCKNIGVETTLTEAHKIWQRYSDRRDAQWLSNPDEMSVCQALLEYADSRE